MQLDEKTARLLREKGLRCICQLCDCGRSHKHQGCTKNFPNMKSTFQLKNGDEQRTDYQVSYGKKDVKSPICSLKPAPGSLNPLPPVMDFRTTNRTDFKRLQHDGRTKPCKLQEEYEGLTGPFQGDSVYRVDFPGHRPQPVKIERPVTQKTKSDVRFDSRTMYKDTFSAKQQSKLNPFPEMPSFAYSILYPDQNYPVEKISFKNAVHAGEFAARPDLMAPKGSTIQIGMEGKHEFVTTNNTTFKSHPDFTPEQHVKASSDWKPRPKFECRTQAQDDFKGFGNSMPATRKAIPPAPDTIDLRADKKRYLETTKNSELKVTWDKNTVHRPSLKKVEERYTPPKEKFEAYSVMRADFKKHDDVRPVGVKPPDQTKKTEARFFSDTSYKSQFPDYGRVDTKRYGDSHDQQYYVKPFGKFPEDATVMRNDFKDHGAVRRRSPFIPNNERHAKGEQFFGETNYRNHFQPKDIEPCSFTKLLTEKDTARFHETVADFVRAKPSRVGSLRKKPKGLTASI